MWGRVMATGKPTYFCPSCDALYQVVKIEAGIQTSNRQITCRACGAPLPSREGKFVLKIFYAATGRTHPKMEACKPGRLKDSLSGLPLCHRLRVKRIHGDRRRGAGRCSPNLCACRSRRSRSMRDETYTMPNGSGGERSNQQRPKGLV